MSWLRWWTGTVNDPKWRIIAARANCRPGDCVAVWAYLLEIAKDGEGDIAAADAEECAVILGYDMETVEAIIAAMRARHLIEGQNVAAWAKRQPKREDDSKARVAAHRERARNEKSVTDQRAEVCNAPVTHCNAPESETETETETEKRVRERASAPPAPELISEDWQENRETALAIGIPAERIASVSQKFRANAKAKRLKSADWDASWLKWCIDEAERRGWQPSASTAPRDSPGSIYITPETHCDAWMAWASARHGKPLPTDKNGGWRVPSLMPPERMQS